MVHGHNWSFEFTFSAGYLDKNEFVVDFGRLQVVKSLLTDMFDHTLLLNSDDPWLMFLRFKLVDTTDTINQNNKECTHLAKIVEVPNCGAEGFAYYLLHKVNGLLESCDDPYISERVHVGGLRVVSVTVHEDSKNKATYTPEVRK